MKNEDPEANLIWKLWIWDYDGLWLQQFLKHGGLKK